jgi:hypothetical protein
MPKPKDFSQNLAALEKPQANYRLPAEARLSGALDRMSRGTTVVLKVPFEWTKANLCLEAGGVNQNTLHKKRPDGTKKLAHLLRLWDRLEAEKPPKGDLTAASKRKDSQRSEIQSLKERLADVSSALHEKLQETWLIQKDLVEQQKLTAAWRKRFYEVIGKPDPGE